MEGRREGRKKGGEGRKKGGKEDLEGGLKERSRKDGQMKEYMDEYIVLIFPCYQLTLCLQLPVGPKMKCSNRVCSALVVPLLTLAGGPRWKQKTANCFWDEARAEGMPSQILRESSNNN